MPKSVALVEGLHWAGLPVLRQYPVQVGHDPNEPLPSADGSGLQHPLGCQCKKASAVAGALLAAEAVLASGMAGAIRAAAPFRAETVPAPDPVRGLAST